MEYLQSSLQSRHSKEASDLFNEVASWLKQMEPIKYQCLGCEYCLSASAMNLFDEIFPKQARTLMVSCASGNERSAWPPVPGEYFVFCEGSSCPIAVSTLGSIGLAEAVSKIRPRELCIVGKTETENIGVEKIIKNIISNPTIRFLILSGNDPKGHCSGKTLLALWNNGVDESMRVIESPGRRPVLRNVTREEVEAFRKQVQIADMIGIEDADRIVEKIKELSQGISPSCGCEACTDKAGPVQISTAPVIRVKEPSEAGMDKAGYFVVIPQGEKGFITVEHYSYENKLLRTINGTSAESMYGTIIENGWVTQLGHAAYIGKELERAELSMKLGFKYVQDDIGKAARK